MLTYPTVPVLRSPTIRQNTSKQRSTKKTTNPGFSWQTRLYFSYKRPRIVIRRFKNLFHVVVILRIVGSRDHCHVAYQVRFPSLRLPDPASGDKTGSAVGYERVSFHLSSLRIAVKINHPAAKM